MFRKNILLFIMVIMMAMVTTISSANADLNVKKANEPEVYTLQNGLTVYLLKDTTTPAVSVYIGYKVGSRNEQVGLTGISHLLEHLLFRGTNSFPEEKFNNLLYRSGAEYNAFTSYDVTVYYETLPAKFLEDALRLESDRMVNSNLSDEAIAKEKNIVTAELDGYRNNPESVLGEEILNAHFRSHSYRWPVIGYKNDVHSASRDDIYKYYRTYYVPNNAILSVAGNFETKDAKKLIEKYFGKIKAGDKIPEVKAVEPEMVSKASIYMEDPGNTSYVSYVFHADNLTSKDHCALKVLDSILYSGKSSRLYKALVMTGKVTSVSTDVWDSRDPGIFTIDASLAKDADPKEVEKIIFEELKKIKNNPPTGKELEKVKNTLTASFIKMNETVPRHALSYVYYGALGDSSYLNKFIEKVKTIKSEDVAEVAKKYLDSKKYTSGYLKGLGTGDSKVRSNRSSGMAHFKPVNEKSNTTNETVSQSNDIESLVDFKFDRFTLDNGITVIVKENHSMPSIHIGGYIKDSGAFMEKKGLEGVASVTSAMLERGTKSKTYEEIVEIKDFNAISTGFSIGLEKIDFGGWALTEKLDTAISILSDMIINPSFPEEEFKKCLKQKIAVLEEHESEPSYRAISEFLKVIYPEGDPRGHHASGTVESLKNLKIEDLKKFHNDYYRPENMVIVLLGDVNTKQAKEITTKYFASWKPTGEKLTAPKAVKAEVKPERINIYMPNKTQNTVLAGCYGVNIKDEDYCAFDVFNKILGGGTLNNRLGREIRVKQSLVYGINSANIPTINPPLLYIVGGTSSENVDKVIESIKEVVKDTLKTGVTEQELLDAKSSIANSFLVSLGNPHAQMDIIERIQYNGFSDDYITKLAKKYESLTLEEVNNAGRKYLDPDKMKIIVSGSYQEEQAK